MEDKFFYKTIELYLGRTPTLLEYEQTQGKDGIFISLWNIEDKPQPTIQELELWQSKLEIQENNEKILGQIAELEKSQLRATRELILNPNDTFSLNKLKDIDNQIQILRMQII